MIDETDEALIQMLADLFLSSPRAAEATAADELAKLAYEAAVVYGHSKGWMQATRQEVAQHVKRRVEWRLRTLHSN